MTATKLFDVPNLDDLSVDPGDYLASAAVFERLASYSKVKAQAMRHRLDGNLSLARLLERRLETLYHELPDWARW